MSKIDEIDLGQNGQAFLQENLKAWGGLAEQASHLVSSFSRTFAFLPSGIEAGRAHQFEYGGLSIGNGSFEHLARHLIQCSPGTEQCSLIIQDTIAGPDDPNVKNSSEERFFYRDRIYYFLNSREFSECSIIDTIQNSRGFWLIGFLVTEPVNKQMALNRDLEETLFRRLEGKIREVFVSAYDGESFVVGMV